MKERNKIFLFAIVISAIIVFPQFVYFYFGKTEIENNFERLPDTFNKGFWDDPYFYLIIAVIFIGQLCIYFVLSYFVIRYFKKENIK